MCWIRGSITAYGIFWLYEKVEAPNSKGLKDLLISKEIIPFSISFLFIHKKN